MKCYHPILRRNPDPYKIAGFYIYTPCGKCAACLSNRREQWSYRLKNELETSKYGLFMTYTYEDENLPVLTIKENQPYVTFGKASASSSSSFVLYRKHIDDYKHLLRERLRRIGVSVRYYAIGEYGTHTYRPHYHALLFFNYEEIFIDTQKINDIVSSSWHFGNVCFGHITPRSIRYVLKDMVKQQYITSDYVRNFICKGLEDYKPFSLVSTRPGIGAAWYEKHKTWFENQVRSSSTLVQDGHKISIPRYYKDKFYKRFEKTDVDKFGDKHVSLSLLGKVIKSNISKKQLKKQQDEYKRISRELGIDERDIIYIQLAEQEQDERQRLFRLSEKGGSL